MNKILLTTFLLITSFTNAQAIKKFTDTYDGGTITYDYYIDATTSEMLKHGNFKYEKKLTYEKTNGTITTIITGKFKDGLRDGAFQFNIKNIDYPNNGGSYTTKTTTATLSYANGFPNGLWKVNSTWKTRDYRYRSGKYVWSNFSENWTEYAETFFRNGIATGKTKFKNGEDSQSVSFTLSPEGFMVGQYIFKDTFNNFDLDFNEDGILVRTVIRDKSGNVESQDIADSEMITVANQYLNKTLTKKDLLSKRIMVDTVDNGLSFLDYNYIFEKEPFLFKEISGDKTISKSSSNIDRIYKRFFQVKKANYIDLSKNGDYERIGYDRNKTSKVERLKKFLKVESYNLSPDDKVIVETALADAIAILEKENQNKSDKITFEKKKTELTQQVSEIKVDRYFKGAFNNAVMASLGQKYNQVINSKKNLEDKYKLINYGYIGSKSLSMQDDTNYTDELSRINISIKEFDENIQPLWANLKKAQDLSKIADLTAYKAGCYYQIVGLPADDQYMKIYRENENKSQPLKGSEKKLFEQYTIIQSQLTSQVNASSNVQEISKTLNKSIEVSEKIITMKGNVDNKFVKTLRKTDELDTKVSLFLE